MTRSFPPFVGTGSASDFQREGRQTQRRRRKPRPLAVQSLEPRLALAVGVAGDFARASAPQADTTPPEIRSIAAPKGQTYGEGRTIAFRVNFTEPVVATGTPTLPITIGNAVRQAEWNGRGSGSKSLTFRLGVQSGDVAATGVRVAGPIVLSDGAAIRDRAGNDLTPTASGEFPGARVDALAPTVMSMGQVAINGKSVSMQVTFTEPVTVRGKPTIPFTLNGVPRRLVYARGSGSNVLVFKYRAAQRETPTPDNVAVGARITNGRIVDRARNAASLAQPTDISLSAASLPENEPAGTVVGVLSAADADGARDHHTFALVEGPGSTDNASFTIDGKTLKAAASFDYEAQSTYSVRVRTTDQGGLFNEKTLTITVTNLAVEMAFVTVEDAGNKRDYTGPGAVDYQYQIGTYEVTIGQYVVFLNAVAADDPYGLYKTDMALEPSVAGISRSGSPGSYTYTAIDNGGSSSNRPITCVSWFDAARFANWMHNGQPGGPQGPSTTERGAYTLDGQTSGTAPAKNPGAECYIPTENEWYKAAYYSPVKDGIGSPGYFAYATQSDSAPGNTIGGEGDQANYYNGFFSATRSRTFLANQNHLTDVGAFTNSASYYGTFDQSGNVLEWNDLTGDTGSFRGLRGGNYLDVGPSNLSSSQWIRNAPSLESTTIGFRLARLA